MAFKPASAAALTGTLSVTDNATGSPQTVTLTGTGIAAPASPWSATSLAFPATTLRDRLRGADSDFTNRTTETINLFDYAGGDKSGGLRRTEYMRGDVAGGDLPGVCSVQTSRRGGLHSNLEHYRQRGCVAAVR